MYQSDMERLEIAQHCPCNYCQEIDNLEAYRFMYGQAIQADDFVPQLLKAEREGRPTRGYIGETAKTCDSMGLSFFLSSHQAHALFKSMKGFPKMNPPYTCVSKCQLTGADGVMSSPTRNGHFNVHPYVDAPMLSSLVYESSLAI
jgi:hypothetical protein